jgi:5-methylthioribose kinase
LAHDVVDQLVARGLAEPGDDLEVTALAGGVSNDVVAVLGPHLDVVVKRALSRLRVEKIWDADPRRIQTEGWALRLAASIQPTVVPRVIDLDENYLVIERAPHDWEEWRTQLLAGGVDRAVAGRLGEILGCWQQATHLAPELLAPFEDRTAFFQLRVDPFHLTILAQHADLAGPIQQAVDEMLARRTCLVHGDYTPKNILVAPVPGIKGDDGPTPPWVLDWEVAHLGDPDFDPASMLAHLLIKTIYRPGAAAELRACARSFVDGWQAHGVVDSDEGHLVAQIGCMLLARVDGKSPAPYLADDDRRIVRALGRTVLLTPPSSALDIWEQIR